MKKIKFLLLAAAFTILLAACGKEDEETFENLGEDLTPSTAVVESTSPVESTTEDTEESIPEENTDDSVPPQEGMVRSRLTNEWVDPEVANTRPIAVMTPNESSAIPQYNLSQASILYEAPVEGGMTRMLAIYEDWEKLDKIGNVRSLRTYYGYLALEWDAFIVHVGGPYYVDEILNKTNVQDLDEDHTAFFRSSDRKAPHNCYVSGSGIKQVVENRKLGLSYRGLADEQHYQFTSKSEPNTLEQYSNAVTANKIDMSNCYKLTRCYFEYNEEDGLYYRYQHLSGSTDGPHIDGANGEQLTFKNVIVQNMYFEDLGDGYLAAQNHDSSRDGWYFTEGKGIHVNWKKTTDFGATRYYDDNGNEIVMNTGKTMVLIIKDGSKFSYE